MIDIKGLTKRYEDSAIALDHVTYSIQPGEVFCLLGANGAGKTTTINILLICLFRANHALSRM